MNKGRLNNHETPNLCHKILGISWKRQRVLGTYKDNFPTFNSTFNPTQKHTFTLLENIPIELETKSISDSKFQS